MISRFVVLMFLARMATAAPALEVGARYVVTRVHEETTFPTGRLHVSSSSGFGATAELFWTERVSTQLSATFVQPESFLFPNSGREIDLATIGLNPVALTARLYFPARFSPFLGGGAAIVIPGDLEDRFGDDLEIEFDRQHTYVAEAGMRYRKSAKVAFDLSATYMPLEMDLHVRRNTIGAPLPPKLRLNPVILGAAASWRF